MAKHSKNEIKTTRAGRVAEAMYELNHYHELAADAVAGGQLEEAEGWLRALCDEVSQQLDDVTGQLEKQGNAEMERIAAKRTPL